MLRAFLLTETNCDNESVLMHARIKTDKIASVFDLLFFPVRTVPVESKFFDFELSNRYPYSFST